jgi:secondary thiamine-phosphate synthase enzyme
MKIYQNLRIIKTKGPENFHDLTKILEDELKKSDIKNGIMAVCILHTTACLALQEPDPLVHKDSNLVLDYIVPRNLEYHHTYEGITNATAHQKQMLVGNSIIIPISNGSLILGSWQKPFLIELFTSMERKLFITIIGE